MINSNLFLKADGKVLRDHYGTGNIVTLRGTNVGGWQVMEQWMCPTDSPDQMTTIKVLTIRFGKEKAEELIKTYEQAWWQESDFDYAKELNFNVLRLPISYLNLMDECGNIRKDTLDTIDWFVDQCNKRDIYVILDLHAAPGSQNGRDHSGDIRGSELFHNETYMQQTIFLWEELARHYKDNPTIAGYDLLNEPEGDYEERAPWGAVQFPFYDRLYQAIRRIDPDHMIILEAVWEPTDMIDPKQYGWENVMYQYHCYGWEGIDDFESQKKFTDGKLANYQKANFNVPVLIGEFTLFDLLESWDYAIDVYEKQGWSWTTWTYKTVEYGNWGIFTSKKIDTPDVHIETDPYDVIKEKWSKVATDISFSKNTVLFDLLKEKAKKSNA